MELWYTETYREGTRFSMKVKGTLYHAETPYQVVDVVDTDDYGRVMLLDGLIMLTDRDEFIYHEMIAHVPMLAHPNPKKVLIIGGGDGGTLREVLRHPEVEEAHLCEIDDKVIEASKEFFPAFHSAFSDPRSRVFVEDGIAFIERSKGQYDVIIVDSTDPIGPAVELFEAPFFTKVSEALRPGGVFVQQSETVYGNADIVRDLFGQLRSVFPKVSGYMACIPTYPTGFWTFCFCSAGRDPFEAFDAERAARIEARGLRYYNADLHRGAFALPTFVRQVVRGE
jgi:spermidine synthase